MSQGVCPKCHRCRPLTRHHVYPRRHRHHWHKWQQKTFVYICRECHDRLELLIPIPIQPPSFYTAVIEYFLGRNWKGVAA